MNKKRILILSDDFPPIVSGGAGVIAGVQAKELAKRGFDVMAITTTRDKDKEGEYVYEGIKVKCIYVKYKERFRAYISLYNPVCIKIFKKILQEFKPDIVHAHNIHQYLSYYALVASHKFGAKVFLTAHDAMMVSYGKVVPDKNNNTAYKVSLFSQFKSYKFRVNPFRNLFILYCLRYVNKIFVVSHALNNLLVVNGIKNTVVVHNGIDLLWWMFINEQVVLPSIVTEILNKNYPVFLFGGRISSLKGSNSICDALKIVKFKHPELKVLVAGSVTSQMDSFVLRAKELDVFDMFIFLGWCNTETMKLIYHKVTGVLVPSIYLDPFPTVNLEAMACGTPVIGTCFGGTGEAVRNNKEGIIINPKNPKEFATAISVLTENKDLRSQYSNNCINRMKESFDLQKCIDVIMSWYNQSHE